jgi:hypothetical protein
MSQAGELNSGNSIVPVTVPIFFQTDAGTATAAANILKVNGAGGATTSAPGNSNQIVITAAAGPTPFAVLQEFDDFLGSKGGNRGGSKLSWGTSSVDMDNGTADHPGVYKTDAGQSFASLALADNNGGFSYSPILMGGGITTLSWVVQLPTLSNASNSYDYYAGFLDANSLSVVSEAFQNGIYFKYNHALNGGQWVLNATRASTTTSVNTTTAVTTAWTTLTIVVNASNTSASFFVNNVLVGTAITTNLPLVSLSPFISIFNLAGSSPVTFIDLFYINIVLTNARST